MKEEGILNPEDNVLIQYRLNNEMHQLPMAVDIDDVGLNGILCLYPENQLETNGFIAQAGGVVGTVRSVFRAIGFGKPSQEETRAAEPPSKQAGRKRRGTGLYGDPTDK